MKEIKVYRLCRDLSWDSSSHECTYSGHDNVLSMLLISRQKKIVIDKESMQILPIMP